MRTLRWRAGMFVACCAAACQRDRPPPPPSEAGGSAHVTVTRPTVIAYFVIPAGAVDTLPDLAVEADDWNVAMSALGDSLEASGVGLAIVTEPRVRISMQGRADTTLALGAFRASGYVFARPGDPLCVRAGGADADSVKAAARAYAKGAQASKC